jgi:hypothetical protein
MGYSVYDYSSSEASSSATGGWNTAENQDPSTVNDGQRQHKQNVANYLKDQGGVNTTGGSANAQTVTLSQPIATTIPTGFVFTVKLGYTNTSTTVTLNVNSIGAKSVKVNFGGILADPIPGDMRAGAYGHFIYDGTYMVLLNAQQQARYAPGTLYGLTLSNNSSDATNDIDIAVGSCRSSDDSANLDLLSALTKRLDASWAVGSGNGGLDTGSIANGTYHVWLIKRSDTGVVDALFSTSASSPTMPTNYDLKRRIGSIIRSSAAITPFTQKDDLFLFKTPIGDAGNASVSTSRTLLTTSVPANMVGRFRGEYYSTAGGGSFIAGPTYETDASPSITAPAAVLVGASANVAGAGQFDVLVNSSSQIAVRSDVTTGKYTIVTLGYIDTRGRMN